MSCSLIWSILGCYSCKKRSMLFQTWICIPLSLYFHPSLLSVAFDDSFTNNQFSQTIRKGGEGGVFRLLAFTDSSIYFLKQLLGGIWEAFVVATWETDQCGGF